MTLVTTEALRAQAEHRTLMIDDGTPLSEKDRALISLAAVLSVTSLNQLAIEPAIEAALDAGATVAQVQEIAEVVSGLGTHSLMGSAATLIKVASERGLLPNDEPLDAKRQAIWDTHVGTDPFWAAFSKEMPGFLDATLRLSPEIFEAFFNYCAVPWKSGHVPAPIKELASMACDVTPTHRFGPGFRVHLANVIKLGVGRLAILETIEIAARSPDHIGYDLAPDTLES